MSIDKPTGEDLRRDLAVDYEYWNNIDLWMSDEEENYARKAWGSAIRLAEYWRQIARKLDDDLAKVKDENATLREGMKYL